MKHSMILEKTNNPYFNLLAAIAPWWPEDMKERLACFVGFEARKAYAVKKGGHDR